MGKNCNGFSSSSPKRIFCKFSRKPLALEVCVDNVESALNAWKGGASRLELCSSLNLGGLTPSLGLFKVVKKLISPKCAIFVMIRVTPRETFVYDEHDVNVMKEDMAIFRESGADGFVFGCLNEKKFIDKKACSQLLEAAKGLPCTFHRAFDIVENLEESLKTLINMGFSRILTSGQEKTAFLGRQVIKKLLLKVKDMKSDLIIVAGGGITPSNLKMILEATGVEEFHGSARSQLDSTVWKTDLSVVEEMIKISGELK